MSTHFVFLFFLKIKEGADKKNQLTVKNAEKKNVGRQRNTQHISPI